MFKFIIASNGHAVSHIPPFETKAEACAYLLNNDLGELKYTAEVVELEAKPVTCTCTDWSDEEQPSLECFGCDSGRLAPIDYVGMLQKKDYEISDLERRLIQTQARLDAIGTELSNETSKLDAVRLYVQASINRGEWEDELDELFWHELAEKLGLDLGLTEEVDVTFTITYSGTVTVPKDADLDDLEIDLSGYPDVTLNGNHVGDVFQNECEITRD
jgi:hypothetical protein